MPKKAALTDIAKTEIARLLKQYVEGVVAMHPSINSRRDEGEVASLIKDLDFSLGSEIGRESDFVHSLFTKETVGILR